MQGAHAQSPPDYKYKPSSAQSTRQILDKFSASSAHPCNPSDYPATNISQSPTAAPFHPHPFRRSSTNYAEAEARARSSRTSQSPPAPPLQDVSESGQRRESVEATSTGKATGGWMPRYSRKMSWNQEDMKREVQMKTVKAGEDSKVGAGFSEQESAQAKVDG